MPAHNEPHVLSHLTTTATKHTRTSTGQLPSQHGLNPSIPTTPQKIHSTTIRHTHIKQQSLSLHLNHLTGRKASPNPLSSFHLNANPFTKLQHPARSHTLPPPHTALITSLHTDTNKTRHISNPSGPQKYLPPRSKKQIAPNEDGDNPETQQHTHKNTHTPISPQTTTQIRHKQTNQQPSTTP